MAERADSLAPETINNEQQGRPQAQDVARDAKAYGTGPAEDSEHGGKPNPAQVTPDDAQDLVDKMNQMRSSGQIDNDAYAGEPQMDDEEGELGPTENRF
jgi:hypothetical protein